MTSDNNSDADIRKDGGEEQEIDLLNLARRLWDSRRTLLKAAAIGAVVGLIIGFSTPKEYTSSITLVSEPLEGSTKGNLGALASMAGIGGATSEALNPDLYPDVVSSVPFVLDLFDVPVTPEDGDGETVTLQTYLTDYTSAPWWKVIMSLPAKAIGGIMSVLNPKDEDGEGNAGGRDAFNLSEEDYNMVMKIRSCINLSVEKKSNIINIDVVMQDPLISAQLADTVAANLQKYVVDYRTNKARVDLEYAQTINDEAREDYYKAQQRLAVYVDRNQNIAFNSIRTEEQRLRNEAQLAYDLYNNTAQRLQLAKVKVQENTPVYTVLQPASVPLRPSKPRKMMLMIGFAFLAVAGTGAWILFLRDFRLPPTTSDNQQEGQ